MPFCLRGWEGGGKCLPLPKSSFSQVFSLHLQGAKGSPPESHGMVSSSSSKMPPACKAGHYHKQQPQKANKVKAGHRKDGKRRDRESGWRDRDTTSS